MDFRDAVAWVRGRAFSTGGSVVVGVTGPAGAGKSTLARAVSSCVLSTDDYLPDYDRVAYHDRDDPAKADLPLLVEHLSLLAVGQRVRVPVWSFQTHRREGSREASPADIIVVEGLHALHSTLLPMLHIRVFVDAPRDVRWSRWEAIETSGERGWGVAVAREFFNAVAEPTYARFEPLYRSVADVVVLNHAQDAGTPALQ